MKTFEVHDVVKRFPSMGRAAVDHVNFSVEKGNCLGVVGGSGSGKSTLARIALLLEKPDEGSVFLEGNRIDALPYRRRRDAYRRIQMVFQNPLDSFDPRCTLGASIAEYGRSFGLSKRDAGLLARKKLEEVGLDASLAQRLPSQVSGGQCQRAAFARALMGEPSVLVCDEVTSSLDMVAQAHIVALIERLKRRMAIVFITHDLALVSQVSNELLVMHEGRVVEEGETKQVLAQPASYQTKLLLRSVYSI